MNHRGQLPKEFFADDAYSLTPHLKTQTPKTDDWLSEEKEGQLSVDVFETEQAVIITAPIAGVKPEDLEVYVSQDLITIRGKREDCIEHRDRTYLYQECHWGRFSRSIILPVHVSSERAEAALKNGVLAIRLPKTGDSMYIPISEMGE